MTSTIVSDAPALARRGAENGAGGWIALAGAPAFALMALGTACFGDQMNMVCVAARTRPRVGEMTVMYLLMSAVHLGPWLRLIPRRPDGA
jgi:hypothetical protein